MAPLNTNVTESPAIKRNASILKEVQESSHFFVYVIIIVGFLVVVLIIIYIIKWIIRERRLRELRHRLIPLYTFDPNDEDDWETELLSQDQSIYYTPETSHNTSKDYNSVNICEDEESLMNKRKLNSA